MPDETRPPTCGLCAAASCGQIGNVPVSLRLRKAGRRRPVYEIITGADGTRRSSHMHATEIDTATLVDDVMRGAPATIRAFLNHRMNCPGCPIACFHTVADACREHHVDADVFLRDLRAMAAGAA